MIALPVLAAIIQVVLPQGPHTIITPLVPAELPPTLTARVLSASPGLTITSAERKEREGRIYFDVAGQRPDGAEIELDVQQINGDFDIVEIQRDLASQRTLATLARHRRSSCITRPAGGCDQVMANLPGGITQTDARAPRP